MNPTDPYQRYEGKALKEPSPLIKYESKDYQGQAPEQKTTLEERIAPYYPSDALKNAVEYARILRRPLLLRGEPGCGKTRLAQAVAYELYGKDYRERYFEWHIKSTTKAREGLYTYDHLARLRDVELLRRQSAKGDAPVLKENVFQYRNFGALGKAFITSEPSKPAVLLIDEIDKADIDFPNDLLLELDQKRFYIEETNEEIIAKEPPLIFITSNDEKELPNAFLRRCVFHYIDFPDDKQLLRIAKSNLDIWEEKFEKALPVDMMEAIVTRFYQLYQKMKENPNTDKRPSTSEMIDWLKVVYFQYFKGTLDATALGAKDLPFPEVVLKSVDDYKVQMNKE
ncbi:MAG TPA: MoxR family ATPase [Saprospiraceae bacterium]|nr:MoxR family ATPase [Saprospiraceae bacterium]HMQ82690.1 MoxR family ATPase [Saprospiraceae bacterium]